MIIDEHSQRRSGGEYSAIITEAEVNNYFSMITWVKRDKMRFIFQNSICLNDKTIGGHLKNDLGVIITSGKTNQSREFSFFT